MIKILNVVGARPQFVKAAVISREVGKYDYIEEIIVHTGQHFDKNMSDIFFEEMQIPTPHYNLDINGLGHGEMTGKMIIELELLMMKENPDFVVVYGDTNSTLAAAIAAKKLGISLTHIEAGVRNFDNEMPEEINRCLVDRISDLNFCCTWLGLKNLETEGFGSKNISSLYFNTGDVMYDAALFYDAESTSRSNILNTLDLTAESYSICTIHRASNTDDQKTLGTIVSELNCINKISPIVFPVHPRTRAKIKTFDLKCDFKCIDPVGYFDMLQLIKNSKYVLTDSGGVVREAYFFKKKSLFLLENLVWPELVIDNTSLNAIPIGTEISRAFHQLSEMDTDFSNLIYGDGNAGEKIVSKMIEFHNQKNINK